MLDRRIIKTFPNTKKLNGISISHPVGNNAIGIFFIFRRNLLAIRNNYPKYVVSLDEWISGSITDGIQHLHLATFLQMDL